MASAGHGEAHRPATADVAAAGRGASGTAEGAGGSDAADSRVAGDLGEDGLRVFALAGRRKGGGAGFAVELHRVAGEAEGRVDCFGLAVGGRAEGRVVPVEEHSARPELSALQDLGNAAHPAHGDAHFAEAVFPVLHRALAEDRLQERAQFLATADAVGVRGELRAVEGRLHHKKTPRGNQLDYVFASRGFHERVRVRALNAPRDWGPSDHCRLVIEVE